MPGESGGILSTRGKVEDMLISFENAFPETLSGGSALPVGGSRSGLLCPSCFGGKSGERSLSVFRNEGGHGAKCHRASCGWGMFKPGIAGLVPDPPSFTPRPYPNPVTAPDPDNAIWELLRVPVMERTVRLASMLGVHSRYGVPLEIVWDVRDYDWRVRGHVSRKYPGKEVRTWKGEPGPWYSYHGFNRTRTLWLVEDQVSAAQIALAGGNAIALLGCELSLEGQLELGAYLRRLEGIFFTGRPQTKVALDPDAFDNGVCLTKELTSRLGYDTMFQPLLNDPKDLPEGELERMVKEDLGPRPKGAPPYSFCRSCGVRTDYKSPTCLYPQRHCSDQQDT